VWRSIKLSENLFCETNYSIWIFLRAGVARVPPRQHSVDSLQLDQLNDMNEGVLYTLAQVATTLAGFSGLVVVFRARGTQGWSSMELRILWFLLGDSFLVLFFALLPVPLCLLTGPTMLFGASAGQLVYCS
jgi:hypothetical protein